MAPDFEELLQIIRTAARGFEGIHIVLASGDDFTFLEETPQLAEELLEAMETGYLVLGFLGWEVADGRVQAHKMFFRWHGKAELSELFDRICEVGVNSIGQRVADRRKRD